MIPADVREIRLTRGRAALVDPADYPALKKHSWCAVRTGNEANVVWRAVASIGGRNVLMHRLIMAPPVGMVVDHRDGNGLHNWRSNLRVCTHRQNAQNRTRLRLGKTSRFLGVSAKNGRWLAHISIDGNQICLGRFKVEEEAALAYQEAALTHFGDFASPLAGLMEVAA